MWKKLFAKTKTEEISENTLSNSIVFNIDNDNKVNLTIDIKNTSLESADKLGFLLFLINEGYYVQSFLDIISDLSKKNIDHALFAQKTINSWSTRITDNADDNDPIVKPTEFNNSNTTNK